MNDSNPWEDDSKRGRSPPNRTRPDYFNVTLSTMGSIVPRGMTAREIEETESPLAVLIGGRKAAEELGLRKERGIVNIMEIQKRLKILQEARSRLTRYKAQKEYEYTKWLADNELLLRQIEGVTILIAENEQQIKADAIVEYEINKNKHPYPGVEIKLYQEVKYDGKQAEEWAREHNLFLKLDEKGFEKFAKGNPLDFVEVQTIPKAQIATDLEKVLEVEVKS